MTIINVVHKNNLFNMQRQDDLWIATLYVGSKNSITTWEKTDLPQADFFLIHGYVLNWVFSEEEINLEACIKFLSIFMEKA